MKKIRKRLLLLFPISLIIAALAKYNYWIAEYIFARIVYKYLSQPISNIIGIIPISVMEVTILLLVVFFIVLLIYLIRLAGMENDIRKEKSISLFIDISSTISVLFFIFVLFAGTNYYRYSFAEINNIKIEDSTLDELYQLNIYLSKQAFETRNKLNYIQNILIKMEYLNFQRYTGESSLIMLLKHLKIYL